MTVAPIRKYFPSPFRKVLFAIVIASITVGLPDGAHAFTCSDNEDCAATAAQCDPGRTACNDGICNPSSPQADGIGCVLIPNNSKCDDGLFCTLNVCNPNHGCNDPVPVECGDSVDCTADICDEDLNKCTHTRRNSRCSNGLFCDGREICDAEDGCVPGTPPKCGDNVDCTTDTCDETNDVCKHVTNNSKCNNGLFCDGTETCALTGCVPGTPPNCSDTASCTADTCDEANDVCKHVTNPTSCDDGLYCNGVETCSPTGCKAGTPPNCNDNVTCTADTCDEANNICKHVSTNSNCNDGLFCNGVETCSATGCKAGTPPNCGDGIDCTTDRCVESNDTCAHTARNENCDNGKFCDGTETCSPTGCKPGTPVTCADSVPCTIDKCVEATQTCTHTENNAFCTDGQYCNGVERCDYLIGCYAGLPPNCGDNVDCTVDTCVEETDTCAHSTSDVRCTNGKFCDGTETCDILLGCKPGTVPNCDDTIPCTNDICSDVLQTCVHAPDNTQCSNGLFCDGVEVCSPALGCQPGTGPVCADTLDCTTDVCAEGTDSCIHVPNAVMCGNDVIDAICGEECDNDNGEVCNNEQDDDGDQLIDCADPDCTDPIPTCDDHCQIVPPCLPLRNDPAVISWGGSERAADRPGAFSFHARLLPSTPIDPLAERFIVTLSNDEGQIYRAELKPVDLRADGSRFRFRAVDPAAVAREGGIAKLSIQRRIYSGQLGYAFRVTAYGDFSRATLPRMTTQVYFGDDVGYVTAEWTGEPGHWILRQKDYDDGVP